MGGPPVTSRGGMVHLILSLCRQFEEAFGKAVDGGKGGGEQILRVFEERLGQNIQQLQFKKVSLPSWSWTLALILWLPVVDTHTGANIIVNAHLALS